MKNQSAKIERNDSGLNSILYNTAESGIFQTQNSYQRLVCNITVLKSYTDYIYKNHAGLY